MIANFSPNFMSKIDSCYGYKKLEILLNVCCECHNRHKEFATYFVFKINFDNLCEKIIWLDSMFSRW